MSITLVTLQERVARELNAYVSATTSAAGNAGGTTLVASSLSEYPDNWFKGKYVKILDSTTTTIEYEARKVRVFEAPTGTFHFSRAFTAQVPTSTSIAIYDVDPATITHWINDAIRNSYPNLTSPVHDATLITGNMLPNANFEEGTVAPTGWTADTTTAAQSSTCLYGSYSTSLTTAAGNVYISSDTQKDFFRLAGQTIEFKCWCKTAAASNARIQVITTTIAGDTSTTSSDYHTGDNEWELLYAKSHAVPLTNDPMATTDLADITFKLVIATTTTAYFDNAYVPFVNRWYALPASIETVQEAYECNDWKYKGITERTPLDFKLVNKSGTKYLYLPNGYTQQGRIIELVGYKNFSALDDDSDTLAVDVEDEKVIVYGACHGLLNSIASSLSGNDKERIKRDADKFFGLFEMLKRQRTNNTSFYRVGKVL